MRDATMLTTETTPAQSDDGIDVVDTISPEAFLAGYIRRNKPLKMTGMMDSWPAMSKWSFDFFQQIGSTTEVHLEEGNVMQEETGFHKESFSDYIEQVMADHETGERAAYLSVFRIFDEFPALRNDVDFSILDQHKIKSSTAGWIGPTGTRTGYHIDWGDNILAQVCGRKCVHLASPQDSANMYISKKFDQGTTMSEVDLHDWDQARHPNFGRVQHRRLILHPGDMVFIPRGWWHDVESLDRSISVSNITYDWKGIVLDAMPHRIKQTLHDRGLWKCDCTCHITKDGKWLPK